MHALKLLFVKADNIQRSSYVWNMVSSVVFACQSAAMLIIITRTCGLSDAGVFSISYSVASMMAFIGEYGVRRYQASDVNEEATFSDYLVARIITCSIMILACLAYGIYGVVAIGYSGFKFSILLLVCYTKVVETVHDLFYGRFQQMHRLDVSAKTTSFRTTFGMLVYAVSLIVTSELLFSTIMWAIAVTMGAFLPLMLVAPDYCDITVKPKLKNIRKILVDCFPLFVGLFLLMYIGNAAKYAIDANLNDEIQAKYNFIFMPVFVIGLFANFVFNPVIVELADAWESRLFKRFINIVRRQMLVIVGLTSLAIVVAASIGCPVLGTMYHTDLSDAKAELCILMLGGGMLAMVNFMSVIATIIRKQRYLVVGYVTISILALTFSGSMVKRYELMGAAALYTTLLTALAIIFGVMMYVCVKKGTKSDKI